MMLLCMVLRHEDTSIGHLDATARGRSRLGLARAEPDRLPSAPMRQATIRWMIFLSALLAVGPAASWLLGPMRSADGSFASTPLLSTQPVQGLVRGVLATGVALAMGLLACRIAGFRSAISAVGLVLAWVAWRMGDVEHLIRTAGSGSPLTKLAVEGAIFGLLALACAGILAALGRTVEADEKHDLGHTGTLTNRLLGGKKSLPAIGVGLVAAAGATWIIAVSPLKGQALAGAVFAGIAAAITGRIVDPRVPLAVLLVPSIVLGVVGPITGQMLASGSGVVADAYRGALSPLANVPPLQWIAGAFLGVPLGAAWAGGMTEKRA